MADLSKSKPGAADDAKGSSKRSSNTPRKRVSQACERCRARKDKCDGVKPVCATCIAQGAECIYDSNTKKRGLPEGYVRGLEKLWGLSIREVENIESTVVGVLAKNSTADAWSDTTSVDTLQETWRNSKIAKELERLLPLLEIEDKPSGKRKREAPRPETTIGIQQSKASPRPQDSPENELQPPVAQAIATPAIEDVRPFKSNQPLPGRPYGDVTNEGQPSATGIPSKLPERAFRLIDIYFSYTHSWLPILEKYDIMRLSHQYSRASKLQLDDPHKAAQRTGEQAVLWALLAYADQQRSAFSGPLEPSPAAMYEYARALIPSEDEVFDLGHVQALLILTLFNMGFGRWSRAWLLVGKAARVSIDMNLHKLGSPVSKRSQHVFLGCFVLDTIVAGRMGRRPQLRRADLGDRNCVEEDGLEEWDPYNDCLGVATSASEGTRGPAAILSTFNQLVRMLAILNDAICIRTTRNSGSEFADLIQELRSLEHPLPRQFSPTWEQEKEDGSVFILPHQYHLHIAYVTTATTIHTRARAADGYLGRSVDEVAASTIRQMAKILKHHAQHFGLLIPPPTYDFHTMVAGQCCLIDQNPLDDYRLDIQHALSTMVKTWPTYKSTDKFFSTGELDNGPAVDFRPQYDERSSSSGGSAAQTQAQAQFREPRRDIMPDGFAAARPTVQRRQYSQDHLHASPTITRLNSGDQELLSGFGKSPLIDLSMASFAPTSTSPSAIYVPQTPLGAQSWSAQTPGRESFSNPATTNIPQLQSQSNLDAASTTGLDIDGDSMFNEFATLDAMEWANNWDQSLVNLGFTDPSSMNQDFYAFCREPDPLYPNNLVQQLLSNNSMNGGGVGFDGSLVGFPNPHVEASQILQQLSTAQERGTDHRHSTG